MDLESGTGPFLSHIHNWIVMFDDNELSNSKFFVLSLSEEWPDVGNNVNNIGIF